MINGGITRVLWIGTLQRELAEAHACLMTLPNVSVIDASDPRAAAGWLAEQETLPDLMVITQLRPGEVAHAEVERLRRLAPLTRLVSVLGSWCEGESRSGHPWPAVERIYWHQWPAWIGGELWKRTDRLTVWSLPLTVTPEERLLAAMLRGTQEPEKIPRTVAIYSSRRESAEMLIQAAGRLGHSAVRIDTVPQQITGISLAVWDGDRCNETDAIHLQSLVEVVRPAPVIALLSFPRLEECQRMLAAGAREVFSKPLLLDDLLG